LTPDAGLKAGSSTVVQKFVVAEEVAVLVECYLQQLLVNAGEAPSTSP